MEPTESAPLGEQSLRTPLIELAIVCWRTVRLCARVIERLDAGEGARYANQLRFLQRKVSDQMEAAGMAVVSVEGERFDPGIAASAVNLGDFQPEDELLVDHMVEPIIMGPDGVIREGIVTLRTVGS